LRKKGKKKCIYSIYQGNFEYEQNDREVKGFPFKMEGRKENPMYMSSVCENDHRSVAEGPSLEINKW